MRELLAIAVISLLAPFALALPGKIVIERANREVCFRLVPFAPDILAGPRPSNFPALLMHCLYLVVIHLMRLTHLLLSQISLTTQVVGITQKLTFRNNGKEPVETLRLCYSADHVGHVAIMEVTSIWCLCRKLLLPQVEGTLDLTDPDRNFL